MSIEPITLSGVKESLITNAGKAEIPFGKLLSEAIEQTNITDMTVQQDTQNLVQSGSVNLHQIMIDMEKADIALQYTIQVRNKLLEAYQEVMRMQL